MKFYSRTYNLKSLILIITFIGSLNSVFSQASKSYKLVWTDEFDGYGAIDTNKWFHQTKLPLNGSWYNGEIQHYTNRTENSSRINGVLRITAKKETFNDQGFTKEYTSARLNSKFAFKYGRVEFRAKLPTGVGTWPAVWLLGKNIDEPGAYFDNKGFGTTPWPACGEIDILEHWGSNQNFIQSAIHTPSSFGNTMNKGGRVLNTASSEFHVYAMEWTSDKITFSVDSIDYYTYEPAIKNSDTWPFNAEQYLLINFAIQGNIASNFNLGILEIDYMRVYQETSTVGLNNNDFAEIKIYPVPVSDVLNVKLNNSSQTELQISINSFDGKIILRDNFRIENQHVQIKNLDFLEKGTYIISFDLDGKFYRYKIIK